MGQRLNDEVAAFEKWQREFMVLPDKDCVTLADGSCVGEGCMHDPKEATMNEAELQEIRRRESHGTSYYGAAYIVDDIRVLLAHIDAQAALCQRAIRVMVKRGKTISELRAERDTLAAEVEQQRVLLLEASQEVYHLTAEVEALKKAPDFQRGEQIIRTHADVIKRLQAEVERLKKENNDLNQRLGQAMIDVMGQASEIASSTIYPRLNADIDSLRALVREVGEIVEHYRRMPGHNSLLAEAWQKKAAKVTPDA